MARDHHAPTTGPLDGPPVSSPPGGFARVAKQVSRWTVNLVATAAVLLMMLLLGQQLNEYWRGAAAPATLPGSASTSPSHRANAQASDNAATVDFGNGHFSLVQSHIKGDRAAAVVELRRLCREAARSRVAIASEGPPQPAEARLLRLIASESSAERLDAGTELFEMPGAIPMTVVTNSAAVPASDGVSQGKVAAPQRRVVVWGIALRTAERVWVVYAFHPPSRQPGSEPSEIQDSESIPLPKDAEPILSVQRDGSSVTAFRGRATLDTSVWREFYERWAVTAGYSITERWTEIGGLWRVRLSRDGKATVEQVDIQFGPDGQGGLRGLITSIKDTASGG